ncbi:putative SNARE protein (Ufe1) [Aspergillus novofumigatus IBT 16806]|uniref:Putative snare protein n=1 Tax=Aspergillus novofumigatus (strain IBT 16806) TaxID=1392255 RepID=A0A2I1CMF7_ASPN1|nr:putative snare protein [Aspergillus novofumigatus IBT 16806]PKX98785.1 putative snare protein [Aspergillus novofumigatus IBT 16806]
MTDITSDINQLLKDRHANSTIPKGEPRPPSIATADEFLKEAYRINSHIHSLLLYLQSIRHSYLSTTQPSTPHHHLPPHQPNHLYPGQHQHPQSKPLTDTERDSIDSSTALLLRDLSTSIANLSTAESLRQETESGLLRKKHRAPSALLRWAAGASALANTPSENKSPEQIADEERARTLRTVRESILWFLRRGLERAAEAQRDMVEKRIERVREKEKSVLYKSEAGGVRSVPASVPVAVSVSGPGSGPTIADPHLRGATLSETETAAIEAELSPEQLQLFAEENDLMLRQYEDALSKVQNAEKSLLEISSLQQTLVSHLSTQEEHIEQLVMDASTTTTNIGQGNKELKRATQRRSTAQAVFWGTVGLCTWLVVWDLIF